MKEIEIVHNILDDEYDQPFKIYPFTTENIKGYIGKLDFNDKKVLTVCGSGDHILNIINNNGKEIDSFDINILAYQYYLLKEAAIKTISYQEYLDYFCTLSLVDKKNFDVKTFDYKIYKKIRKNLNLKSKMFWDEIYKINAYDYIFSSDVYTRKINIKTNLYLEKDNYNEMKNRIWNSQVSFKNSNLANIRLNKKYDYIFLSNIAQYMIKNSEQSYRQFLIIISNLLNKLNENGRIYLNYFYDYDYNQMCYNENMPIILNEQVSEKYLNDAIIEKFDSMNKFQYNIDTKDAVKILTK